MAEGEPALYQRVAKALDDLERDPFQGKRLAGALTGRYTYRVGTYHIVCVIHRHRLRVLVIDVGHRRDIHR